MKTKWEKTSKSSPLSYFKMPEKKDFLRELEKIYTLPSSHLKPSPYTYLALEVSWEGDPLKWLPRQRAETRIYWSSRDQQEDWAGVGKVFSVSSDRSMEDMEGQIRKVLRHSPGVKIFGGVAFDPEKRSQEWSAFPPLVAILPQWMVCRRENQSKLILHLPWKEGESLPQLEEKLHQSWGLQWDAHQENSEEKPLWEIEKHVPDQKSWTELVNQVIAGTKQGQWDKVVLARQSTYQLSHSLCPFSFLDRWRNQEPRAYHFYVQLGGPYAFIGASPERLYHYAKGRVFSEAVAGTRPRTGREDRDRELAKDLWNSSKERAEHRWVRDYILGQLGPLGDCLQGQEEPQLLSLSKLQHLYTPIAFALKDEINTSSLLAALHPTPAVGGWPQRKAFEFIRQGEPFCRGWYAGLVGWWSREEEEFAVAIRSALVGDKQISLFAGAGIVSGSQADKEWEELEQKISTPLSLREE